MDGQAVRGFLHELNWLDLIALVLLLFFLIMGWVRGLIWQALQLVKLIGGFMAANLLAETVGGWLIGERLQPPYSTYLGWVIVFVAVALGVTLAGKLLDKSMEKLELKSYDRLAGGAIGLASGWLALVVVVLVLYSKPPLDSTRLDISHSYAGAYSARTALAIRTLLPTDIGKLFERIIDPAEVDRLANETKDRKITLPGTSQPPAPPPAPPPVPPTTPPAPPK